MSSDAKFTQGPWKVGPQNGHCGLSIGHDGRGRVATVYLGLIKSSVKRGEDTLALPENEEAVANAHLVKTAPKMYRTLETILEIGNLSPHQEDIVSKLLAEARGEL